jgi:hypothetical protein
MATYDNVSTDNLYVQSSISIAGDTGPDRYAILSQSSTPIWGRNTGLVSQYTDDTNDVQNICGAAVNIAFSREERNFADVKFVGDAFVFNVDGLYKSTFQCYAFSSSFFQSAISFFLNGNQIYGNFMTVYDATLTDDNFYMEYTADFRIGDTLTVVAEKVINGPAFLRRNPIYGTPITQLTIERLF